MLVSMSVYSMVCTYGHKKIQTVQTINIGLYMCRRVTAVQSGVLFVFFFILPETQNMRARKKHI
jgi:hypothetical protein